MFMETNLGDPGLFPGTMSLEQLLISRFAALFHCPEQGGMPPAGARSPISRHSGLQKCTGSDSASPNVIVPDSAHFSFKKACDILGLEMRRVPLTKDFRMDADLAAEQVDKNTIALVGVAGTTEYGMVDPIAELGKIAGQHDLFFHVDAAFGGMVIPFLADPVPFDFAVPGVTSIAVDPHKMGMSTIPCGCLLTREPDLLNTLNIDTPYLTVKQEYTLAGTRPGAPVAGALAVMDYLGCGGDEGSRGRVHEEHRAADRRHGDLRDPAGGHSRRECRDLCLRQGPGARAVESLVDLQEAPPDRLHAPCAPRPYRGIYERRW